MSKRTGTDQRDVMEPHSAHLKQQHYAVGTSRSVLGAALQVLGERQVSSAACSTSYQTEYKVSISPSPGGTYCCSSCTHSSRKLSPTQSHARAHDCYFLQERLHTNQEKNSAGGGGRAGRTYLVQASVSHGPPRITSTETYAEFTQLQKLLQQYQRSLGAVGKAATAFTEQVWFRKNASGRQYLPHQLLADLGKDELAATEVRLIIKL